MYVFIDQSGTGESQSVFEGFLADASCSRSQYLTSLIAKLLRLLRIFPKSKRAHE